MSEVLYWGLVFYFALVPISAVAGTAMLAKTLTRSGVTRRPRTHSKEET